MMDVKREVGAVELIGSAWMMEELRTVLEHLPTHDTETMGVQACLDAVTHGRRVLWTPFTSFTRCNGERTAVAQPEVLVTAMPDHDPYYNPNLVPGRADWLERPGCAGAPPYVVDSDGRRHWS